MSIDLSMYDVASSFLPRLPNTSPLLYNASELSDSISKTLSKTAMASSFLPSSLRANPLCNNATVLSVSVSRTLSKYDNASVKLFFLEK